MSPDNNKINPGSRLLTFGRAVIFVALLGFTAPVAAQDFDRGFKAYKNGDYAAALREWRPLAKQGDAMAQFNLGNMYRKGQGVGQDKAKAVHWFRLAAKQGYAKAQLNLGNMYRQGEGVRQDYAKAVAWFHNAAKQGDAKAQNNLGVRYATGQGVARDYVKAYMWWFIVGQINKAAQIGKDAKNNRGILAKRMTAEAIAKAEKLAADWIKAHPGK